jgi:hypothetical protein
MQMKHDFRNRTDEAEADRFRCWLEQETVDSLRRGYGDSEATKAAIFLFVNRAHEAHMPAPEIGAFFGGCVVGAGFREEDEGPAFDWLEHFAAIAEGVHGDA